MSKVTGITDKEKIRLRKTLWQMVDWLYIRGKITKEETERAHEEFDCLRWKDEDCLLYTSPSPRDLSTSRMPSSA